MEEWKIYKISEVCQSVSETYRGNATSVVLINTSDVLDGEFLNHEKVPNKDLKGQFKKVFHENDILYSEIRPTNKRFAFVGFEPQDYIASTKLMVIRANDKVLPRFLFHHLKSEQTICELQALAESRSGTFPQITFSELGNLEISLPPIETQKLIVRFLDSIENKIALNNRINHNLEAQAQALFKSWFVDFEPFKDGEFVESELGMIPEGWRIKNIGELPLYITDYVSNGSFASLKENVSLFEHKEFAHFVRNTDLKSGIFPIYVDQHSFEFLSKSKLNGGEIIISNVGDVGSVYICPKLDGPMTLGNNVIMIKPAQDYLNYYLYIFFKWFDGKNRIKNITGGSAMPKFNKTDFKSISTIVPPEEVLLSFHMTVKSMFEEISSNSNEAKTLSVLRDEILPKLMSGALNVNKIDC